LGTLGSSDSILVGFSYECGFNPEADVMAAEAIEYVKQLMKRMNDFEPTEENLAYDAVKKAGPKGSLMTDPHTLKNMKLQYQSKFADHRPLNVWLKDRKSMFDRVIEKVKEIERFELPTLPSDMQERMKKIVEEADQKLKRY
jgi:trimethylamine:corrinoid methyltransferase-like protein